MDDRIKKIADHFGYEAQSRQLIEEMAELTQEINKKWRCDNGYVKCHDEVFWGITEEIADVEIMLEQVKYLLNAEESAKEWREHKIKRTLERIKPEKMVQVIGGQHGIHYGREYKTYHWRVDPTVDKDLTFKAGDIAIVYLKNGDIERVVVTEVKAMPESEAAQYEKAVAKVVFDNGK